MFKKYRKKPVVIEAVQFKGTMESAKEILSILKSGAEIEQDFIEDTVALHIKTLEGKMTASDGDWIIKGIAGEYYPCKPDIFSKTYEEVTE